MALPRFAIRPLIPLQIHISVNSGHHPSYQALFLRILGGEPSTGPIRGRRFWRLVRASRVFFATIDADYAGFISVALLRALQGKPTTGLFLRPLQCFRTERPFVYAAKRRVFRWLRRVPGLRILSIIPYDLHPELREVSHDWIHDPQLWDLWLDGPPVLPDTALSRQVAAKRQGRTVMIFIGSANRIKGFSCFVEVAQRAPETLLVVAGRIAPEYQDEAQQLRANGMIVEDRYVTDDEILSLYKVADYAWCRYAPDYDQASGVFGRAAQTNAVPIVRDGSLLERLARSLGVRYSTADALKEDLNRSITPEWQKTHECIAKECIERLRRYSL